MAKPFPDSQLNAIVLAVEKHAGSATLLDIAFALNPPPPLRNVQRWLSALVKQKRLVRKGSNKGARYELPSRSAEDVSPVLSAEGAAIQCLVNQPLELRAAADYRRLSLESYVPNRTWYLPADVRARLATPIPTANSAALAQSWRDPAVLNRIVVDLAGCSGWLETQFVDQAPAPLSMPEVTAWLAQPEMPNARADVQLLWNQRSALNLLLSRAPNVALTREWLQAIYAALTKREQGAWSKGQGGQARGLLRTESLTLARTMYRPPAEPWTIETCFNEILGWVPAIADPIEQAFFVIVHLLYLQPFTMLNASMACLAVNIPLLRAGLPPITFANIRGADLLDALRGVWELNRTELLRDVFVAAYDNCRARYGG